SSALLASLGLGSLLGLRIARRRHRQLEAIVIELAARRVAATLAQPAAEPAPTATDEPQDQPLVNETEPEAAGPIPYEAPIIPITGEAEETALPSEAEPPTNHEPLMETTSQSEPPLEDAPAATEEANAVVQGAYEVESVPEKPSQG
ncbi:MAG: hypothetical protein ABJF10_05760, partial [Chthoniobacter sp.]